MPQKNKKTPPKGKTTSKTAKKNNSQTTPVKDKREPNPNSVLNQLMPFLLALGALFILVCFTFVNLTGIVGLGIRNVFYGLFGVGAFAIPVFMFLQAIFWKKDVENDAQRYKVVFALICLIFISVLVHVFSVGKDNLSFNPIELFKLGLDFSSGGAVGGLIGSLLMKCTGIAGTLIISIFIVLALGIFLFGLTPYSLWLRVRYSFHKFRELSEEKNEEAKRKVYHIKPVTTPHKVDSEQDKKARFNPDVEISETAGTSIDEDIYDEIKNEQNSEDTVDGIDEENEKIIEGVKPLKLKKRHDGARTYSVSDDDPINLKEIFADPDEQQSEDYQLYDGDQIEDSAELELTVERKKLYETPKTTNEEKVAEDTPSPEYVFPPISLLKADKSPGRQDSTEELQATAKKLVDTLASFNVKTKIINVSRGPTITRYELAPEVGTRVRSIVNLVDDIALSLASTGVRIEAPIPGKGAVGIEVPNRTVATVYLRELIENKQFSLAQSKICASLGMDVAGEPVYLDIAKMPHLLIAGATGMGKSVCINSLIVSLLYKSTPDEVKLILIDPKKVELNIYNGLPHLLVPVVSEPKKAAGSLHWAVTEMERRFELIEEVGVRDIKNYNAITKNDPDKEYMPQIVIIIDELADLMMTAPDEVEESICRLAQKARAAGMHLIIGTQRPSVDVITGLIKANIPSRIAFTVASQVDSRTIIDITGAEKLIGRGDMLYAPVGSIKPIRVQGAFVSEAEVEEITGFIKSHYGVTEYSEDVMESIEREAAMCGQKKKGALSQDVDGDDIDSDPMLKPAIELAVESGKISTSLIQRRLSLGYGRAAKLIDKMQSMGIVSEPEGQKPRTVLITKEQFMEMVLKKDTIE